MKRRIAMARKRASHPPQRFSPDFTYIIMKIAKVMDESNAVMRQELFSVLRGH